MSNHEPNVKLGQVLLDSNVYSPEKLSALVNSGFISKGSYYSDEELTISKVAPLSVVALSKETYSRLNEKNELEDEAIYLVQTDNIDAFGKTVVNVSSPINNDDVANKRYVDDVVNNRATQLQQLRYAPKFIYNEGANVQYTDFNINGMFYDFDSAEKTLLQELAYLGRENITTDINNLSIDIFERNGDAIGESIIASSIPGSFSCNQLGEATNNNTWQYVFKFDNVKLDVNKTYILKFSRSISVKIIKIATDFKCGTNYNSINGFLATQYIKCNQPDIFSCIIFNDKINTNKYRLSICNGKIVLNKLAKHN